MSVDGEVGSNIASVDDFASAINRIGDFLEEEDGEVESSSASDISSVCGIGEDLERRIYTEDTPLVRRKRRRRRHRKCRRRRKNKKRRQRHLKVVPKEAEEVRC